jgi:hypothetical protein
MPIYTVHLPQALNPFEVIGDRLNAYLAGKGYAVNGDAQIFGDGSALLTADRDPSTDVATFTNAPTAQETNVANAINYLKSTYVPGVLAILPAARTPEQRAILSILVILKAQLQP